MKAREMVAMVSALLVGVLLTGSLFAEPNGFGAVRDLVGPVSPGGHKAKSYMN